jgi:hypothetical protein
MTLIHNAGSLTLLRTSDKFIMDLLTLGVSHGRSHMQREIPGPLFQLAWQMLAVPRRRKYGGAHTFQVSRPYAVHLLRLLCTGMDSGSRRLRVRNDFMRALAFP